jgi:magnesium chelatase subunit D
MPGAPTRIRIRREDFRVVRFRQPAETTTIFAVDASGSAALHRLAEVKGAVALLLGDCYRRRDQVALLAFRGCGAELLLPPTGALVRVQRCLAALPGGGGTPLAAGIDAARELAEAVRRRGQTPLIVLLTDGRANIARDGGAGRAAAQRDATAAAQALRAGRIATLLVDTAPRPSPLVRELAGAMGGSYLALPNADPVRLSDAVRAAAA